MESCGWLRVKQLVVFKTKLLVHKTLLSEKSLYLHSRFYSDNTYTTRQHSTTWCIMLDQAFRCKSFRHRGADIRTSKTLQTFKFKIKRWIEMNTRLEDQTIHVSHTVFPSICKLLLVTF